MVVGFQQYPLGKDLNEATKLYDASQLAGKVFSKADRCVEEH